MNKRLQNEYSIDLRGKNITLKVGDILDLLNSTQAEFVSKLITKSKKLNISQEEFAYIARELVREQSLIDEYINVPKLVKSRYEDIEEMKFIDIEFLNGYGFSENKEFNELMDIIEINDELRNAVMEGIKPEYNNLEKAIFIYAKLCKILSYNEEFYVTSQIGSIVDVLSQPEYISKVTPTNNEVVCYNFTSIFAKLLIEQGIECTMMGEYGSWHSYLYFGIGKFYVKADSTKGEENIMDIEGLKFSNENFNGLFSINQNDLTLQEFNKTCKRVLKDIREREKSKSNPVQNLPMDLKKLKSISTEEIEKYLVDEMNIANPQFVKVLKDFTTGLKNNDKKLIPSLEERKQMLIDEFNLAKHLKGMDLIGYIFNLKQILFTSEERKRYLDFCFTANFETIDPQKEAELNILMCYNPKGLDDGEKNQYYITKNMQFEKITQKDLQAMFDREALSTVGNGKGLRGISVEKGGIQL